MLNIYNPIIKIFHFHFYKNAGTSVDAILQKNFFNRCSEKEFTQSENTADAVLKWMIDSPHILCFSSHTAQLSILKTRHFSIIPIILIRHPIDRIASVYRFEKLQMLDIWESRLARSSSMKQYIEARLNILNDRQCRNFHCARLSELYKNQEDIDNFDLDFALKAVEELPFIGLVERMQDTLKILEYMCKNVSCNEISFEETRENSTSTPEDLGTRLDRIKGEIGNEFYNELTYINENDILLYETVLGKLEERIKGLDG